MSTIATVRPKDKPSLIVIDDEARIITDSAANGVRSTRWADFRAQLLGLIPFRTERNVANGYAGIAADGLIDPAILRASLVPEEVANDAAKDALVIVAGDIGRRLVRVTASGNLFLAKATGSGADKFIQFNTLPGATEALAGVAEIATDAEIDAEIDDSRITSPKKAARAVRRLLDPVAASRQGLLGLALSDGATAGRGIVWTLGSSANVAGSDLTEAGHLFRMPSSSVGGGAGRFLFIYSTNPGATQSEPNTLSGYLLNDDFIVRQNGAAGTDNRILTFSGLRTALSGQWVNVAVVFTANATSPVLYVNGVAVAGTLTTGGTVPNWMLPALTATIRGCGLAWPTGEFRPGAPINRALSAAEIVQMVQTGALLPTDRLGGSVVNKLVNAFVNSGGRPLDTFSGATATAWTATKTQTVQDARLGQDVAGLFVAGRRYRVEFALTLTSGTAPRVTTRTDLAAGLTQEIAAVATAGANAYEFVSNSTCVCLAFEWAIGATFNGSASGIKVTGLGAIIQPEITRTALLLDHGINRIRGVMTAGVQPLSSRDPSGIRGSITTTGNILGLGAADPLWFETGLILSIRVKPTANAVTNTTFRLNTSGGTIIGTVATTTLNQWTTLPFSAGNAFEVSAGDKFHVTTDAALDFEIQWARR